MKYEIYDKLLLLKTIPGLSTLNSRLRNSKPYDRIKYQGNQRYFEQLNYYITGAAFSLAEICKMQSEIINDRKPDHQSLNTINNQCLNEWEWFPISFEIDRYLESAHRAQNSIWIYLTKLFSESLPQSLDKIIKRIEGGKLQLNDTFKHMLLTYWNHTGETLKHYRDVSQHFAVISSDGRINILPKGDKYFYLVLPNNPQIKDPYLLNYEEPRVYAVPYVVNTYDKLFLFLCELVKELLKHTQEQELESTVFEFKGAINKTLKPQGSKEILLCDVISRIINIKESFE